MDKKRGMLQNKRGQELSTNAIILIILAVVVLVVLAIGFMVGWDKLVPWVSQNNVETIKTACSNACSLGSTYEYCNLDRELKDAEKNKIKATCNLFSNIDSYSQKYGIEKCPSLCEKKVCTDFKITVNGKDQVGIDAATGGFNVTALSTPASMSTNKQCFII
jgi:hypothetical protein